MTKTNLYRARRTFVDGLSHEFVKEGDLLPVSHPLVQRNSNLFEPSEHARPVIEAATANPGQLR